MRLHEYWQAAGASDDVSLRLSNIHSPSVGAVLDESNYQFCGFDGLKARRSESPVFGGTLSAQQPSGDTCNN
jgi:hypothetical protein